MNELKISVLIMPEKMLVSGEIYTTAQCAFWVVRWPCSQNGPVSATIRRRGGYRAMLREEGVDTGPHFRGNHGSRVWNSRFPHESCFPSNRTSRDKYMLNNLLRRNI